MLPSDVARLVLVYLKDEGLTQSYKQFFRESPHLEELRNHRHIEPSVPHDKGLHMILNEYAKTASAIKDRLNCNYLIDSLWKMHSEVIAQLKFQYTGNIGLISSGVTAPSNNKERKTSNQAIRSRRRLAELRKQQEIQRKLSDQLDSITAMTKGTDTSPCSPSEVDSSPTAATPVLPISTAQSVMTSSVPLTLAPGGSSTIAVDGLGLSQRISSTTPVSQTGVSSTPGLGAETPSNVRMDTDKSQESQALQEIDTRPEFRTPVKHPSGASLDTPIGKSPKRKSAAPKRVQYAAAPTTSPRSETASGHRWEEDFQDLPEVLESLINNIEFQEKLAQNINSALPVEKSDNSIQPEPVAATDSANDLQHLPTTIEELLNHNISDDTVHEIVNKTSTDPAFESLFSLFNQNSLDSQLSGSGSTSNMPPSGSDTITDQSSLPATPHSSQSQCPEASQLTPTAANQRVVSSTSERSVSSATSTAMVTTTVTPGQIEGVSTQAVPSETSTGAQLQLVSPQCTITPSAAPSIIVPAQPAGTLIALPVNPNPTQTLQQQQLAGPLPSLPGGTYFMLSNGMLIGSPLAQTKQSPLKSATTVQQSSNTVRNPGSQGGSGTKQSAASSSPGVCPIHGKHMHHKTQKGGRDGVVQKSPAAKKSPAVQKSPVVHTSPRSIAPRPLGSVMVAQTLGVIRSLPGSPSDKQQSGTKASSDRPFQGVGTQPSATRSPQSGRNANANSSGNIRRRLELPGHHTSPSAETSVTAHQSQMTSAATVTLTSTPGSTVATTISQCSSSGSSSSETQQRKRIQYKVNIPSRPLDFGDSCTAGLAAGEQPTGNSNQQPIDSSKTVSREKGRQKQDAAQRKTGQKDLAVSTPPPATQAKSTSQKVKQVPSEKSTEVDIAAHMLISLAGSPRSMRRRGRPPSGSSPAKSATRDHVIELRKEIGLTPRSSPPQRKAKADTPAGASQKETKSSSKRKTKTPRKQTDAVTETVVASLPTESNKKSKTPSKSMSKTKTPAQKKASPGKVDVSKAKKISSTKSPVKSASASSGKRNEGETTGHSTGEESKKRGSRGQKRRMEDSGKEETTKKAKTSKSTKKTRKSQGFPSNMDVDKFLSTLKYTE